MDVMHHVKDTQVNPPKVILNVTGIGRILLYFQKRVVAAVMGDTTRKLGAWTVERNDFAKKDYYYNTETEETSWEMPDAVRFYLSPQLTNTLLTVIMINVLCTLGNMYTVVVYNRYLIMGTLNISSTSFV